MDKELDYFSSIQILALKDTLNPDEAAVHRRLARWFSKTFFTPLAVAEELSFEDLLQAKYEDYYGQLSPEDLLKEKERLLYGKKIEEIEDDDDKYFEAKELEFLKRNQAALKAKLEKEKVDKEKLTEPQVVAPPDIKVDF